MSGGRTTQYFIELLAECVEALPEAHTPDYLYPEDELQGVISDTLEPRCVARDAVMNIIALADAAYKAGREEALGGFDIEDTLEREATGSWERTLADNIPVGEQEVDDFLMDRFTKIEVIPSGDASTEAQLASDLSGTVAETLGDVHDGRYISS